MRTKNKNERDVSGKGEASGALLQYPILSMNLVLILAELQGK